MPAAGASPDMERWWTGGRGGGREGAEREGVKETGVVKETGNASGTRAW